MFLSAMQASIVDTAPSLNVTVGVPQASVAVAEPSAALICRCSWITTKS